MCAFVVRPHGEKPQDQGCVSPHSNLMLEYVTKGEELVMFGTKSLTHVWEITNTNKC
jgi:hypothetical protein